jgi:hypothetical protein
MRLSAEVSTIEGEVEIFIYADQEGLDYLLAQLAHLNKTDHVHLFAPAWGGNDLTEEPPVPDAMPVHHIKIHRVENEQPQTSN